MACDFFREVHGESLIIVAAADLFRAGNVVLDEPLVQFKDLLSGGLASKSLAALDCRNELHHSVDAVLSRLMEGSRHVAILAD